MSSIKKLTFEEMVKRILDNKNHIFISKAGHTKKKKVLIMDYLINYPVKNNKILFLGVDGDDSNSIVKIEKDDNLFFYEFPQERSITVTCGVTSTWNLYYIYFSKTSTVYT